MRNCTSPDLLHVFCLNPEVDENVRPLPPKTRDTVPCNPIPARAGGLRFQLLVGKLVLHPHDLEALLQGRSRMHAQVHARKV